MFMKILSKIYRISKRLWKFLSSFKIFQYIFDKIVKNFRNILVEFVDILRKYFIKFADNFGNFSENFMLKFVQKLLKS